MSRLRGWTGTEFHKPSPAAAKVLSPLLLKTHVLNLCCISTEMRPIVLLIVRHDSSECAAFHSLWRPSAVHLATTDNGKTS